MRPRAGASAALVAILAAAAFLRFSALDWGLRHEPDWDERAFVQSAAWMVASGDLDHRFYEYPGLFVYAIAPAVARHELPDAGPPGYLAARRVVAAFGVASVLLVFWLGRRLWGTAAGLTGALLLAVSPLDVQTAHMVRPDVVLAAFVLTALLVFDALGAQGDGLAGVAIGAATAVKFSGVLVIPSYLVRRWTVGGSPGRWWKGPALAAGAALLTYAALSPYTFIHWQKFTEGAQTQISYHYEAGGKIRSYWGSVVHDLHRLEHSFGPIAGALIVLGLFIGAREGRRYAPLLVLPATVIGFWATADVQWPRFLVPITGALALFAGRAVLAAERRWGPPAAVLLAVAAAAAPAIQSARYVRASQQPSTRDRAADWIAAHAADGARILSTVNERAIGIDRDRFEVLVADSLDARAARWAAHMDFLVSGPADDPALLGGFDVLETLEPVPDAGDTALRILAPKPSARPQYVALPLDAAAIAVSENPDGAGALVDGDPETVWATSGPQVPDASWIEIHLPRRATIGRVVVGLGKHWRREPKNLHVFVRDDGGDWRRAPALPGRPPLERQSLPVERRGLELILDPVAATDLRLVQVGRAGKFWNVAELRVDALP
jgi:4-amino-4-deoxy-L-arabinose transferase-like glycosyltransferase